MADNANKTTDSTKTPLWLEIGVVVCIVALLAAILYPVWRPIQQRRQGTYYYVFASEGSPTDAYEHDMVITVTSGHTPAGGRGGAYGFKELGGGHTSTRHGEYRSKRAAEAYVQRHWPDFERREDVGGIVMYYESAGREMTDIEQRLCRELTDAEETFLHDLRRIGALSPDLGEEVGE